MNELCTAWKFDRLKASVLFFLDLGFEMSCECPWWVGWFQGWFCSVLVTHCDVTFGCSLPQLENKLCRAVEGTRHLPIPGDCVLFVLGEPHRVKTAVTLSCQTPFADLPICSIQLWHKGPSHFAKQSLHPEETTWQGLSKFCVTGAYGAFAANLAPCGNIVPRFYVYFLKLLWQKVWQIENR